MIQARNFPPVAASEQDEETSFFERPLQPLTALKEKALMAELTTSLGSDKLIFESLEGFERLSTPFKFQIRAYSKDVSLDFKKVLGKNVAVEIKTSQSFSRFFSGMATQVRCLQSFTLDTDKKEQITYYGLTLRPMLWKARFSTNTRIFFKKKAKDIIKSVLGEHGISFTDKASSLGTLVREYCVQYNESDFDFLMRLMEQEGIFYYFTYDKSGEKLTLCEKNKDAKTLSDSVSLKIVRQGDLNSLTNFNERQQIVTKTYSSVDYDYTKPDTSLKAKEKGEGLAGTIYEYPGDYAETAQAKKMGTRRLNELSWPLNMTFGDGSFLSFLAGGSFKLKDHPKKSLNQSYLLYQVKHSVNRENDRFSYQNSFSALPENIPFVPIRQTPLPAIPGTQTAVVVGPKGQEIACDKEGRVWVQFHWDSEERNGKNSCPLRCMQDWAGPGLGWTAIPRIGMEVVVSFLNGDPDKPLIIGCVYNGKNKLPKEAQDKPEILMLKTKTTPKDGTKAHIMSFDDTKDKEKITFNTTKDYELSSIADDNQFLVQQSGKNTKTQTVIKEGLLETQIDKGEKKTTIKEGNFTITLNKGSMSLLMDDGDDIITVKKGDLTINIKDGAATINVKKDVTIKSEANINIEAKKDISLKASGNINLTATKDITEKATGSINLEATKDIVEKATGNINLNATMDLVGKAVKNIQFQATMEYSVKGLNIKEAATLQYNAEGLTLSCKGTLQATFEGSLQSTLKGGLQALVNGGAQATVSGGAMAALSGAITALG